MVCSISCSIALAFVVGKIYFYNATTNSQIVKHYKEKLPIKLKQLYDKISNERFKISMYGYVLGFFLSLCIIFYNLKLKRERLSNISLVCIVVATCFLTNYFYYMLTPKSEWMLNHIDTPEQTKLWLQLYRNMSVYYHSGLVLGIIAVGFVALAFRR
uniref:Uncharacterized protein n=1 Tax=viral metagenome TaxID=1070528 RepID=A0A6C0DTL2_9ZZZZ